MTRADWDQLKKVAFGSLRLLPEQFWSLTLGELLDLIEYRIEHEQQRQAAEYHRTAWLACHIMNTSGNLKRLVTPDKLLGNSTDVKRIDRKEQHKQLDELKQKFQS
ncbi:phage tail assembly chaperone [Heliobacterium chlorum]|uniref:Phage tail assembly chaperone n=1 Tax=Heliobacterium chlorum TaxID=2698 RepID=A0ABR7T766_HELCL|nr:phage tail assembly chaperone [Heliobacterium chlorum]MBC9785858.1 phage tail assembly chaperone [Heliobacterium chlorum]